jgi:hypothetical protein
MQIYSYLVVDERTPIIDGYTTDHRKGFLRHLIIHHDCELVTDFTRGADMVRKMSMEEADAKNKAIRVRRSSAARRETSGTTREQPCHDRPGVPNAAVATVRALTEADDAMLSRAGIDLPPVDLQKSAEHEPEDSDWEFERLEEHPAWVQLLELIASSSSPPAEPEVAIGKPCSLETSLSSSGDVAAGNGQAHCLPPPEDEQYLGSWLSATSRSTRSWQAPHRPPRFHRMHAGSVKAFLKSTPTNDRWGCPVGFCHVVRRSPNRRPMPSRGLMGLSEVPETYVPTCMNDSTGAMVLIDELLLCNEVKDISFISKMQFKELNN